MLFQRWLVEKPDKFVEKSSRILEKILNEEETDSTGSRPIWPTTLGDKRRVIRDLAKRIKAHRAVGSALYTEKVRKKWVEITN